MFFLNFLKFLKLNYFFIVTNWLKKFIKLGLGDFSSNPILFYPISFPNLKKNYLFLLLIIILYFITVSFFCNKFTHLFKNFIITISSLELSKSSKANYKSLYIHFHFKIQNIRHVVRHFQIIVKFLNPY